MRDLLVFGIVFGSVPFILRRPQIGVMMWVWVSVMNPHRLAYGFTQNFSFAEVVAVATLLSAMLSKDLRRPPLTAPVVLLLLFGIWTGVTTVFALYPDEAFQKLLSLMKTILMALLIPMLFHREADLRRLLWVLVLSIAYYSVKGGAWILLTGGGERVWGPPGSYIEDNNALAVAVTMTVPLMRYLQLTAQRKSVRLLLWAMILLSLVAIIGSYSRGALLACCAMIAFLFWKSRHRWAVFIVGVLAIPLLLWFMPDKWFGRMETITAYQSDSSANMRLNSWGTMINIAKDRPLVGGGFEVATEAVYRQYAPDPSFPPQVAHSIYFQALGEHGFVGLALYLLLLRAAWKSATRLRRMAGRAKEMSWALDFSSMSQVALIGYAVGGAFLSLVNFDVPYYLITMIVAARAIVERESKLAAQAQPSTTLVQPGAARLLGAKS